MRSCHQRALLPLISFVKQRKGANCGMRTIPSIPRLTSEWEVELAEAESSQDCIFSVLPDSVITIILSKVARADWLVRCSATCKRMQELVRQVPKITFNEALCIHSQPANSADYPDDTSESMFTRLLLHLRPVQQVKLADSGVAGRTVWLQEMRIFCVYQIPSLQAWLSHSGDFMRSLSLSLVPEDWEALRIIFGECPNLSRLELVDFELRPQEEGAVVAAPLRVAIAEHVNLRMLKWQSRLMPLTDNALAGVLALLPALQTLEVHCFDGLARPSIRHGALVMCKMVSETAVESLTLETPCVQNVWINNVNNLVMTGPHDLRKLRIRICDPNLEADSQPAASISLGAAPRLRSTDVIGGRWQIANVVEMLRSMGPELEELQVVVQPIRGDACLGLSDFCTRFPRLWRLSFGGILLTQLLYAQPATHEHMGLIHVGINRDEESVSCRPVLAAMIEGSVSLRGVAFSMNETHVSPDTMRSHMQWSDAVRRRLGHRVVLVMNVHQGLPSPDHLDSCEERRRGGFVLADFYDKATRRCPPLEA